MRLWNREWWLRPRVGWTMFIALVVAVDGYLLLQWWAAKSKEPKPFIDYSREEPPAFAKPDSSMARYWAQHRELNSLLQKATTEGLGDGEIQRLFELGEFRDDWQVRQQATMICSTVFNSEWRERQIEFMCRQLKDDYWLVRTTAALGLRHLGAQEKAQELQPLLQSKYPHERVAAQKALNSMGHAITVEKLPAMRRGAASR